MYNNSFRNIITPLLISLGVVVGILLGVYIGRGRALRMAPAQGGMPVSGVSADKLSYTLSLIENLYVDKVDLDSIEDMAIVSLLEELDPHSIYISAADMPSANETLEGEFDGIGVMFNMTTDTIVVLNVIPLGPSDKAGIMNGDRIIMIDDSLVAGRKIPQDKVVGMLRGPRGTEVKLSLQRHGVSELVPVVVRRGTIPIKSIDAAFMITPDIAFVKLSAFAKNSYSELETALDSLKKHGMTGIIFDLRGNSGGFLDQAIAIANMFLPKDELIVYTEDRNGNKIKEYSNGNGGFEAENLVILIDEGSASSSEILAGAVQDNDRGTIIGRRSFGKGLVQRQIPYPDGSALRLTIARYYTPTGRSIQKPYSGGSNREYHYDIINRYYHNEMFSQDSIHFDDSLKFTTPRGKVVYGGGGIMPDVFVPMDTTDITPYFREVVGKNILYKYTLDYTDRHRQALNGIASLAELERFLDSDAGLLEDFVNYAERNGVKREQRQIERSKSLIEAQLRAYIGRNTTLDYNGFYANIYVVDETVLKAIEVLETEGKE